MHTRDWFLVFVSIFVPPVAVWIKRGFFTKDFLINVLLFFFGFIPSLIHSLYIISKHPYIGHTVTLSTTNNHNPSSSSSSSTSTDVGPNNITVNRTIEGYGSMV